VAAAAEVSPSEPLDISMIDSSPTLIRRCASGVTEAVVVVVTVVALIDKAEAECWRKGDGEGVRVYRAPKGVLRDEVFFPGEV